MTREEELREELATTRAALAENALLIERHRTNAAELDDRLRRALKLADDLRATLEGLCNELSQDTRISFAAVSPLVMAADKERLLAIKRWKDGTS